jgi:hypothetical protein
MFSLSMGHAPVLTSVLWITVGIVKIIVQFIGMVSIKFCPGVAAGDKPELKPFSRTLFGCRIKVKGCISVGRLCPEKGVIKFKAFLV